MPFSYMFPKGSEKGDYTGKCHTKERWCSCFNVPREIIVGKKLQMTKYKIGEHVKDHIKTNNDTGQEKVSIHCI